ncbi:MAG: nucleoside triphosphate pyrophosphohydrolase [Treponema sp.]|uniref:nucleoside triphosphate pyrophosphohydrolase n=1 Tax=Treponema sp. TaxID=166 RepID=UPI0025E9F5A9|nr:nucleoside triphosphate pyrophosphohydrolase [Treponema sp.]MBR0494590.1 nucleoside triphosphate pyrophosphohydrolase [Treponema sp.]
MKENSFAHFFEIVKAVRKGCPWDREQTPLSLRSTFFEETCEAIDAITQDDSDHVKEELGDVLLNVVLIAYLFEEKGLFTVDETIKAITEKLIRRHPHVFAQSEGQSQVTESVAGSPEKVLNQWERIKENVEGRKSDSVLDSIPENFPPILKAFKELKKASKVGFDWNSIYETKMKLCEELAELSDALIDVEELSRYDGTKPIDATKFSEEQKKAQLHLEEEFGDALHCLLNYGRWLGVDPNIALQKAMKKFEFRFHYVEDEMKKNNIPLDRAHHRDMMDFWTEAKGKSNGQTGM